MKPAVDQKQMRLNQLVYKHLRRLVRAAELTGASAPDVLRTLNAVIPTVAHKAGAEALASNPTK